ncbi:MAG TPA: preprotein translocase subunit SecA [Candidatus Faecivicinus avistercoris]|nr:preprotein translocase subunit SecA [Candidatus Faecivicinus avistercoris]
MLDFVRKLLGQNNEAEIRKLKKIVEKINALEGNVQKLTDDGIRERIGALRAQAQSGANLDDLLPETYALVREAAVRVLGQRPFDVQLIGAIVLHQGRIAEMRTGEGKTLTATLPAVLNALPGKGVHIVTVNDYLAKFQSEWMGKLYRFLGLSVGLIVHDLDAAERQAAYSADITYGTNNEFGFDYLRDNMVIYKERMVQRPLNFAIVDEVDSILIDEARTPLIISGRGDKSTSLYEQANQFVARGLTEAKEEKDGEPGVEGDFLKDEKEKTISLTERGVRKAEAFFNVENLTDPENQELYHHILAALRAHKMMKRDVDYIVKDGQVVIVDEFTGRLMVGRRYSDGLHQAIEAKEGVKVERESKTLATITFQNYFRMYKKLSGMTGTAKTEEEEFNGIYKLDVVTIPTNRPMIRVDMNDAVFVTQKAKYAAVVDEIEKRHKTGQPVLVGTVSVEKSELLGRMLSLRGIPHVVLNAKFHEKEAEIVAQAGKVGAVTIATNMAGRGTDILLGGNAEFMARRQMRQAGYDEMVIEDAIGFNEDVPEEVLEARKVFREWMEKFSIETKQGHDEVVKLGGLHIIGTERHESRRIDNQLRGRAGRQGDPGSSQFFISFEDDLMRLFGSDRFRPMLEKLTAGGEEAIEFGIVSKQIENAQKRVESRNYDIRLHVLQYDDVMNQQREIIYGQRREVLEGSDMHAKIMEMRRTLIDEAVARHVADEAHRDSWDLDGLSEYLEKLCLDKGGVRKVFDELKDATKKNFADALEARAQTIYEAREKMLSEAKIDMREFERVALLSAVDRRWMDHIDAMTELRDGIGLRAYGQRNPIVEYKREGYDMFEEMVRLIQEDTLRRLYFAVLARPVLERRQVAQPVAASHGEAEARPAAAKKSAVKVGRNDPCPCGSGKKYKNCCGRNAG